MTQLRTQPRTQEQRSTATKQVLLEAARDAILELGYAGATSAEIAKRANVSRGALMHHYANKQQLMLAVADYIWSDVEREVTEISHELSADSGDVDKFIFNLADRVFSPRNFHPILELVTAARHDCELHNTLAKRWERLIDTYDNVWRNVLSRSEFGSKDSRHFLIMTLNLLRGMAFQNTVMKDDPKMIRAQLKAWSAIVQRLMRSEVGSKPESGSAT